MKPTRREREGGFALLLVFLMAAAVAFTIYRELPRAAFESARDKEQLLLDRGNQYKRAIEIYYAVNKRYPPDIKDLEDTNQKRYLRHRYKDPLTGEDEWRIIHTNGSFLTDSLVQKPPAQNAANGGPGAPTVGGGPLGSNTMNTASAQPSQPDPGNGGGAAVNAAVQRRPSDRTITPEGFPQPGNAGTPGAFAGNPGGGNPGTGNPPGSNPFGSTTANYDPNDPRTWPAITLTPANPAPGPGNPPRPGQPPNAQITAGQIGAGQIPGQNGSNPNIPGQPAFPPQGMQNPFGGQTNPGQNQFNPNQQPPFNQTQFNPNPTNAFNAAGFGGGPPAPQINQAQAQGFSPQGAIGGQPSPVGGLTPANGGNAALQAINNQLFRPAQAAAPGGPGGVMGSPGIAGVASKHEGPSIKSYRDRTKYQEWEFVFDASAKTGPQAGVPGQGPLGASPLGANPAGTSPFGQNPLGQPQPGPAQPSQMQPGQIQPIQNQPGQGQPNGGFPPGFVNPFSPQGTAPSANQGR
ncbi:MAG: hypothetical protein EXQ47_00390 [Bryobacterales bacterium]|nr:hypothetical protein [Bryobacterales bacterium]